MKALVFAAGLGTRLGPLTAQMPKALVPVGGEAMLGRVMRKLCFAGFRDIVITACYKADMVQDWLRENCPAEATVALSLEPGPEPFETGGGIKFARPLLESCPDAVAASAGSEAASAESAEPFLVHNVDILSDADLAAFASAGRKMLSAPFTAIAALLVTEPRPEDYRFFLFDPADMRLRGWINTRSGKIRGCVRGAATAPEDAPLPDSLLRMSFCGIHLVSPDVFPLMESWPERFSITDFYIKEAERHPIYGIAAPNLKIIDIGTPETLAQAESTCKKA